MIKLLVDQAIAIQSAGLPKICYEFMNEGPFSLSDFFIISYKARESPRAPVFAENSLSKLLVHLV